MDETKELKIERLEESLARIREEEARRERLERIVRDMLHAGNDVKSLGAIALDGILDLLGFERGFIFISREEKEGEAHHPDGAISQPLVSRGRRTGSSGWSPVRNPEFAVNRSLIKRVLAGEQPLVVNDCLVQPGESGEEQHRAVLCRAFDVAPGSRGILYLDRGLGGGGLEEEDLDLLLGFCDHCMPVLAKAHLVRELEDLRSRVASIELAEKENDGQVPGEEEDAPGIETVEPPSFHGIIGRDEKLEKLFRIVNKIKDSDLNVCIFGESGTGKELLARAIHEASARREKLFIGENCGAIPENLLESELFGHVKGAFTGADDDRKGLFETATGGTLFLDEIGDMSEGMQRKLLRVLQEGVIRPIGGKHTIKVDVRVICASNRDLRHLVQTGSFRADLYYRLNVITLDIPPLRDRPADLPLLVQHFAAEACREEGIRKRFGESAMKALAQYSWPGNVRELRNLIRRVIITCPRRLVARKDVVGLLNLTGASPRTGKSMVREDRELIIRVTAREAFHEIIEECERVIIFNALEQYGWNKSKVTKALRIPRQSLYNKIAKFKLERTWEPPRAAEKAR